MKLGSLDLVLKALPSDLDEVLTQLTGCNAIEWKQFLSISPVPYQIAQALLPFVEGPTSVLELADAVVEHGLEAARKEVIALYADVTLKDDKADGGKPAGKR